MSVSPKPTLEHVIDSNMNLMIEEYTTYNTHIFLSGDHVLRGQIFFSNKIKGKGTNTFGVSKSMLVGAID